jgi:hypothetical protein
MRACIVTITDTDALARSLDRYFRCFFGSRIESYFMTYRQTLLSGALLRNTDLFVLEMLTHDDIGFRAEGIFAAEKWACIGKKVLVISGSAQSDILNSRAYWDLSAPDPLHTRIQWMLDNPPLSTKDFSKLRKTFGEYCRPAVDHHHTRSIC